MNWINRLRAAVAAAITQSGAKPASDAAPPDEEKTAAPASGGVNIYSAALEQMSTAIKWLIAALAAVAATMVAGSQLSSIGKLSWDDDRARLLVAVTSIAVAIALILVSIALLYRVQAPTNSDFLRLLELAAGVGMSRTDAEVRHRVEVDSSLHSGTGSLSSLMREYDAVRTEFHDLRKQEYAAEKEAVDGAGDTAAAEARLKVLAARIDVVGGRMDEYREALGYVAQLDKYLRVRERYRTTPRYVTALSILAALAFVAFAWAANPPEKPADAVAQRMVAAHLTLTDDGRKNLSQRIGKACADAATKDSGIPVVAVSSSDAGIEVIVAPSTDCPEPQRVVISSSDGTVLADNAAVTPLAPR
ncbi:hypothetical protein [Kribbella sp. HUAS MG21]|uniref:DUF4407 domain-containing protein n=1 Tax=Kribbella sp. HUAS MG21 TaxID=3160966 RepID=A0AAU7TDS3_9ACTN